VVERPIQGRLESVERLTTTAVRGNAPDPPVPDPNDEHDRGRTAPANSRHVGWAPTTTFVREPNGQRSTWQLLTTTPLVPSPDRSTGTSGDLSSGPVGGEACTKGVPGWVDEYAVLGRVRLVVGDLSACGRQRDLRAFKVLHTQV